MACSGCTFWFSVKNGKLKGKHMETEVRAGFSEKFQDFVLAYPKP